MFIWGIMLRLKEDETCLCLDADGAARAAHDGVFRRDTRYLSAYHWDFGAVQPLLCASQRGRLHQHLAKVGPNRAQALALVRTLTMRPDGFDDVWTFENTSSEPQTLEATLEVEGDFRDIFATVVRTSLPDPVIACEQGSQHLLLTATASDGMGMAVELAFSEPADGQAWHWTLAPGECRQLTVAVSLRADDDPVGNLPLPDHDAWRAPFTQRMVHPDHQRALDRAIDDVRLLLFSTPHGPYPAAGMPWFVTVFGRDALITGMMLARQQPGLLLAVLRHLAAHQGRTVDPFREEEPGRILHEMRAGELSRTARIPFGRYYGSVDSTPLFLMALAELVAATGDHSPVLELQPAWEAALAWLEQRSDDGDGLLSFAPSGSGLTVQSWKDSGDSMNHADGRPAPAPLSVAEVQGYAFAAFRAAAGFYRQLGNPARATALEARASQLAEAFHRRYWLDALGTYAMAIDAQGMPLAVLSSDPGHLLWTGIVPPDIAPRLVETLMGPALWSGWGLRTLGSTERRYNPVSYHNGSVWPHDTALFAWGLHRYGFAGPLHTVGRALFDLAVALPDHRLPELVAGSPRIEGLPPTRYTHACYPQAWAAASLPLLARLMAEMPDAD